MLILFPVTVQEIPVAFIQGVGREGLGDRELIEGVAEVADDDGVTVIDDDVVCARLLTECSDAREPAGFGSLVL